MATINYPIYDSFDKKEETINFSKKKQKQSKTKTLHVKSGNNLK